jgi:hypothetical protein
MALRALSRRLLAVTASLVAVAGAVSCSSGSTPSQSDPTTSAPPPMATPLVGSVLAPPVPVPATDGRTHLVYEVLLTNALGGPATLNSLTAKAGDQNLLTLSGDNLKYWTRTLGDVAKPTSVIPPGGTAIVWLDVTVDNGVEPPTDITHTVNVTVAKPLPGLVPADVTQPVAPVTVSTRRPVSIAPPLEGANWFNADGCCRTSAHRLALNPINGRLWGAERFAIDWVQLTDDFRLYTGDGTKPESYAYFGAPVRAAGAGRVVAVVDGLPEQVPTKTPSGLPLDQYGGNHVVQDLGDGNYAFYAHLKPGSISVEPGDELDEGQQIGEVGNSGNSDAPHLHFHVMDNPDPLAANGLPFVLKSFQLTDRVTSPEAVDRLLAGQPATRQPGFAERDETEVSPLELDVMTYASP